MKKLGLVLACVCIGTLLAQGAGLALLWSKGELNRTTVAKLLAVLYGIDPKPVAVAAAADLPVEVDRVRAPAQLRVVQEVLGCAVG